MEFADKLINVSLPRVRDFRGVPVNSFDGRGNYSLGVKEQLIFPEIDYDKIDKIRGMDITFVTTAKTDEEARELADLRIINVVDIFLFIGASGYGRQVGEDLRKSIQISLFALNPFKKR